MPVPPEPMPCRSPDVLATLARRSPPSANREQYPDTIIRPGDLPVTLVKRGIARIPVELWSSVRIVEAAMQVDLAGKSALVTGAGRGIGRAIAGVLAANGASVLVTDVDADTAELASNEIPGSTSLCLDVSDPEAAAYGIAEALRRFGRLDILVNNAGINTLAHRVNVDQFPLEEWDRILKVDLTGLFLMSQAAARPMLRQKSGRIINIASVAGLVPLRLQSAFVAAKAGVINLTKSMALELGPHGVLVNGIAPGSILTDGTRQLFYGEDGKFRQFATTLIAHIPVGRPGTPEEVAHCVLFLAAPESSYINGHILTVDGGWTAGYMREF